MMQGPERLDGGLGQAQGGAVEGPVIGRNQELQQRGVQIIGVETEGKGLVQVPAVLPRQGHVQVKERERQPFFSERADREALLDKGYFSPRRVDRDRAVDDNQKRLREATDKEQREVVGDYHPEYFWYDSPIDEEPPRQDVSATQVVPRIQADLRHPIRPRPYSVTFEGVQPPGQTFREYVTEDLPDEAVGVDVGGLGSRLFAGFEGKFAHTTGITLVDSRDPVTVQLDRGRGHDVIPGDLQSREVQEKLAERLDGRQIHVLFSRLGGGLKDLVKDPYRVAEVLNDYYKLVTDDYGKMFVEAPATVVPLIPAWRIHTQQHNTGLSVVTSPSNIFIMEIEKMPGAPDDIRDTMPSARDVRAFYDVFYGVQKPTPEVVGKMFGKAAEELLLAYKAE